uniref:Ribosomal protein S14 n=1 Tax=Botryococcus braunii Showa TaxID=1202541 RepID=A0A167RLY7_BOTBR|nr:ribosomal protein S14 [Botryococcus braunii Showa]
MNNRVGRDIHRRFSVKRNQITRYQLRSLFQNQSLPDWVRFTVGERLNKLPRNSSPTRSRNRCVLSGRGRGVYRFCKLSRIQLRELAASGVLCGISKSSW